MQDRNLKVPQLAEVIGVSEYRLNNWLSAKSKPRVHHLYEICTKLNVSADFLLGFGEEE